MNTKALLASTAAAIAFMATATVATANQSTLQYQAQATAHGMLPGGYQIVQKWGANRFIATRGGHLYYVKKDLVVRLNPQYSFGQQIDEIEGKRFYNY